MRTRAFLVSLTRMQASLPGIQEETVEIAGVRTPGPHARPSARGPGVRTPAISTALDAPLQPGSSPSVRVLLIVACSLLPIVVLPGCRPQSSFPSSRDAEPASHSIHFADVTAAAGIHFKHTNGRSGRLYLPETMGSGCAFLDYNNDGKLDLFLVNSSRLPGFSGKGPFSSALYRNNGDGTFTDVTRPAGMAVEIGSESC